MDHFMDIREDNGHDFQDDGTPNTTSSDCSSRKRTKTGCLTCRRRRIKCGEERPICGNCVKSRRDCEGYSQRLVFKNPLGLSHTSNKVSSFIFVPQNPGTDPELKSPEKSLSQHDWKRATIKRSQSSSSSLNTSLNISSVHGDVSLAAENQYHLVQKVARNIENSSGSAEDLPSDTRLANTGMKHDISKSRMRATAGTESLRSSTGSPSVVSAFFEVQNTHSQSYAHDLFKQASAVQRDQNPRSGKPRRCGDIEQGTNFGENGQSSPHANDQRRSQGSSVPSVQDTNLFEIDEDEDLLDVSDEDSHMYQDLIPQDTIDHEHHDWGIEHDIKFLVPFQAIQDGHGRTLRTFHSVLDSCGSDMLTHYIPSARNSPLNDAATARVFCHFVNVLAPSISMYERHPANPSLIFLGRPVPESQQHLWTYVMPSLALHNRALMQAILAIATLHISKLQDMPATASWRHYHYAIRAVAKNVGLPTRRRQRATLAATLLLGFYEVMSADHSNWTNHLLGAKHLIKEIDFIGITKFLRGAKTIARQQHAIESQVATLEGFHPFVSEPYVVDDDIDEDLVGRIMGRKLKYDQFGTVSEVTVSPSLNDKVYTQSDVDLYKTQQDLCWWFLKQDMLQSFVSGSDLFLDYDLWSHCPPRAPVGRRDAVYGTFDHLVLLLGRVANFSAKDVHRKRKVIAANGGVWQPPPDLKMPVPPDASTPMASAIPPFAGMDPNPQRAKLPRGFDRLRQSLTPPGCQENEMELGRATTAAEEEWQDIRNAFETLAAEFGPDFEPLGPEYAEPVDSPFGPALQYRTYGIAGVWMMYYTGLIMAYRAHPVMPPAAMMAAGISAAQTRTFVERIGRMAAGVSLDSCDATHVNVGMGNGLMEGGFSLFVAGVQLRDSEQRAWTIQRLLDITRLTGWGSAARAARGCESAWEKAAEMGRGPPYVRRTPVSESGIAIWRSQRAREAAADVTDVSSENSGTMLQPKKNQEYALGMLGVDEDFKHLVLSD